MYIKKYSIYIEKIFESFYTRTYMRNGIQLTFLLS